MAEPSLWKRGKKRLGRALVFRQTGLNYFRRFEMRFLRAAAAARPGERLLDVACGIGVFSAVLGRRGAYTVGIDLNAPGIRLAAALAIPRAGFLLADAHALPLAPAAFDKIASICALEHFEDVGAALREMHRVLKPGGRLFLTADSFNHPLITDAERAAHAGRHFVRNFYTPAALGERLAEAGFMVEDLRCLITSDGAVRLARIALRLIAHPALFQCFSMAAAPVGRACDCLAGRPDRGLLLAAAARKPAP